MRVLVVTVYSLSGGGLSSHVSDLMEILDKEGHNGKLIQYSGIKLGPFQKIINVAKGFWNGEVIRKNITCAKISNIAKNVSQMCKDYDFDIIHCHDPLAGYAVHETTYGKQIPVIQTIHGPLVYETQMRIKKEIEDSRFLQFLREIEGESFAMADRLIAVDTGQANIAINEYGIASEKIDIIYNAVSYEKIKKIASDEPKNELPEKFVLVPRRLVPKTGVDVAVKAMGLLPKETDLKMISAGYGPEKEYLISLANEMDIADRIIFLGRQPREEVLKMAKRAIAVLVPSKPSSGVVEATSIAAIEAMACGTPVIVSNIGGLAELVKHEYNGLTVPPNEPQALADAILRIVNDDVLRGKIGKQAEEYVKENLDVKIWFKKIMNVYEKAISASPEL